MHVTKAKSTIKFRFEQIFPSFPMNFVMILCAPPPEPTYSLFPVDHTCV
jgi:hypothetical protein